MKSSLGAQVANFIPWVRPEPSWPFALEEEEEAQVELELSRVQCVQVELELFVCLARY